MYIYIYTYVLLCSTFSTTSTPQLARNPKLTPTSARPSSEGSKPHLERRGSCTCGGVPSGHGWRMSFQDGWWSDRDRMTSPWKLPPWSSVRPFGRGEKTNPILSISLFTIWLLTTYHPLGWSSRQCWVRSWSFRLWRLPWVAWRSPTCWFGHCPHCPNKTACIMYPFLIQGPSGLG